MPQPRLIRAVHVEAGRHLYGGAQQVLYLLAALPRNAVESALVCPAGAAIAPAARALGVTVHELPIGGDTDLAFAWRLRRLLRVLAPDILHLHSRRGADVMGGLAALGLPPRVVLHRRVDNREARALVALKYRLYDRVIAISEGVRTALLGSGVPPAKIALVHSVVDAAAWQRAAPRAEFLREFALPDDAQVVAVVAQLIERKGHRVLFEGLPQLRARHPRLRVLCFGQGPLREVLQAEAAAAGLGETVHFTGFRDDLPRWMAHFDVLAHPAYMEGLGVSLLQAAAAGVPVVGCRAGGIPEAVADGVTGLLVEPGDAGGLRTALDRVLGDAALRQRLGDAGRARVLAEFVPAQMAAKVLAEYRRLLGG